MLVLVDSNNYYTLTIRERHSPKSLYSDIWWSILFTKTV